MVTGWGVCTEEGCLAFQPDTFDTRLEGIVPEFKAQALVKHFRGRCLGEGQSEWTDITPGVRGPESDAPSISRVSVMHLDYPDG